MEKNTTGLKQRIESGKPLLLAEISPPQGSDPAPLKEIARRFAGKVHSLGISDNRDRVSMSALAAAAIVAAEGVEPILHIVTRDRNRIALVSEALGAQALGIRNLLCTSGTHQVLGPFRSAKNVFDIDTVQLLKTYSNLAGDGSLVGEKGFAEAGPFCLGGVAAPYADPMEMQVSKLVKKIPQGPDFSSPNRSTTWSDLTSGGRRSRVRACTKRPPLWPAFSRLLTPKRRRNLPPAGRRRGSRMRFYRDCLPPRAHRLSVPPESPSHWKQSKNYPK